MFHTATVLVVVLCCSTCVSTRHLAADSVQPTSDQDPNWTALTARDFITAQNLSNDEDVNDDDIPHRWDLTEGDFTQEDPLNGGTTRRTKRGSNAVRSAGLLWPNARVPYTISTLFTDAERSKIAQGVDELMRKTCLRFVAKQAFDREYVNITDENDGCFTRNIGRVPTRTTTVSLQRDACLFKGVIVHELLHAVGFYHEHSRSDRDDWLDVRLENVPAVYRSQFTKYRPSEEAELGTSYDYGSVMHYGTHSGSENGKPVLVPRKPVPPGVTIGQRSNLSPVDAYEVNQLYSCAQIVAPVTQPTRPPTRPPTRAPVATAPCVDLLTAEQCQKYLNARLCHEFDFIRRQCRRTCGFCPSQALTETASPKTNCPNKKPDEYCERFRTYCASTPSFAAGCARTCAVCHLDLCKDYVSSLECSGLHCLSDYAKINCLVSCNYC